MIARLLLALIALTIILTGFVQVETIYANDRLYQVSFPVVASGLQAKRIMPFGDSLTRGFPFLPGYRKFLPSSIVPVGNLYDFGYHEGHGGYTIAELQALLDDALARHTPDQMIVMAGSNDLLQGYDFVQTIQGMNNLLDAIGPGIKVYLIPIPPILDKQEQSLRYNKELADLAGQRPNITFVEVKYKPTDYYKDGVHLNELGYEKLGRAITNSLK